MDHYQVLEVEHEHPPYLNELNLMQQSKIKGNSLVCGLYIFFDFQINLNINLKLYLIIKQHYVGN
jgi:hypothetical protein